MFGKGNFRKNHSMIKLGMILLLALSFSASAWAGEPEQEQASSPPLTRVYLPLILFRTPALESSGALDPYFDADGMAVTNISGSADKGQALAVQADGKLVMAGTTIGINRDFAVVRYNPDGSLDTGFADQGKTTTDFAGGDDWCHSIAIQADGKIVLAGYAMGTSYDFAVARYNPDGSLDTSFGEDGKVVTDFTGNSDAGRAVALQVDGKIVVAGYSYGATADFAVVRYNPDGSLDTSLDEDGMLATDFTGGDDYAYAVALHPEGDILVTGSTSLIIGYWIIGVARYNPDGSLDPSFSEDGKVTTTFSGIGDSGRAIMLQPDGKIVVAGASNTFFIKIALVRYNPDGSLDLSFSDDGMVTTTLGSFNSGATAGVLQADGKIVVAGYADILSRDIRDFAVARYNPDGSLDTGFSSDGFVTTEVAGYSDTAYAIVLQADGKIVIAGECSITSADTDFGLARYYADGVLDTSFDDDGKVATNIIGGADHGRGVVLQPDGKIVVAGLAGSDFAVARYNQDGSLDAAFSGDGMVTTDATASGRFDEGWAIALQADGRIIVVGRADTSSGNYLTVVRYKPDGSLDTSFGGDGIVMTDGILGYGVAVQADGRIVVVGYVYDIYGYNFAVARFNPDGSLDGTLDGDGKLSTVFAVGKNEAADVVLQPDGKIVVVGYTTGTSIDFAIARYNSNGSLDTTFDGDGKVITDFNGLDDVGEAIVLQPDGKIVVAGTASDALVRGFAVARYNPDGSLDTSFSGDGLAMMNSSGPMRGYDVALQSNGKIVVAGCWLNFDDPVPHIDFALARFNPDGSLDASFGGDGLVTTDFVGGRDEYAGIVLQPDNRIVVAGYAFNGTDYDFAVARYK